MQPNAVWSFLHNKKYKLDGIDGTFRHSITTTKYPRVEVIERLHHIPSERGKESPAYLEIYNQLGDDFDTDLSNSVDRYCTLALELGFNA